MTLTKSMDELINALLSGNQIENTVQTVSFSAETGKGYICCDNPGCCDAVFDSLDEVRDYLERGFCHVSEWRVITKTNDVEFNYENS